MARAKSGKASDVRLTDVQQQAHQRGLYHPGRERDACGVGFIADINNRASYRIIENALEILGNLTHRGAVGADPDTGDGAGLLLQIPHDLLREDMHRQGIRLPPAGRYAVGHLFLPRDPEGRAIAEGIIEEVVAKEGQHLLAWRDVPVDNQNLSQEVRACEPIQRQIVITPGSESQEPFNEKGFERRLFILRKVISNRIYDLDDPRAQGFYVVSLSSRTVVYKGMFLAHQLSAYYHDLRDPRFKSAMALVHQRFSTNTFPAWELAHPFRMIAHNGEINTLRGNVNWMAARQASVSSEHFGSEISKLWPISYEGQSDSACFDNALEFLVQGGYSLAHGAMMLIPEAWMNNPFIDENRRAFYRYHAALMEPWDGPAAVVFTDGKRIGATLDRNGLRPARYLVTKDGLIVMASEMGVLPIAQERIIEKWRLQPGKMLLVDLEEKRIVSDQEIKTRVATANPYRDWAERSQIILEDLPNVEARAPKSEVSLLQRQQAFGYTGEELKLLMAPMAVTGQEAIGSMGTDTPISALSARPRNLYSYFKQNFAQVTNPPIDPIREELVMSLVSFIGPRPNLFDLEGLSQRKWLQVRQPILTNQDLEKIRAIGDIPDNDFKTITLDMTYRLVEGAPGMEAALKRLAVEAVEAIDGGYNIIIVSDRLVGPDRVPVPALLATAAVHHHLIRQGLRTSVGLVVESGEPREVHHFCALAGYGAEAVNPYLAFESFSAMKRDLPEEIAGKDIVSRYIKAVDKGLLKVMSKMGISTYQSYCGAQIFDAVGLKREFVDKYFFGTATTIEGIGLGEIANETLRVHTQAFGADPIYKNALGVGGDYVYRVRGEAHAWTPDAVATLQHAVRGNLPDKYRDYAAQVNEQSEALLTIRGLFRIRDAAELGRTPIPLEDVEPASEIVKRFSTGAMSFGSLSREVHTTLARAMNRIGGKSNTGEGGEEPRRFKPLPDGTSMRSAIKQIASGRFGVTTEYLVNADQIQIKMAQGAKPGEGGQLPGHKVDAIIAKVRHSTPGVGLISPPPHHDIYSIEDLAQLIFDLKNVNPRADISVKLVAEVGVGTVAAGVTKSRADHITISGYDGGTGASPLTSIKHTGSPWEIGLAETHQTLLINRLRARVALQVDGGLRSGRDVIIGALIGADEFGFATAPLIASGCLMMRKCHLNTCPVGIATQDPVLRTRFKGTADHVINFFFFVAEEVRALMATMGVATFDELIGRSHWLDKRRATEHWKATGLDFSRIFYAPEDKPGVARHHSESQTHPIDDVLDQAIIRDARAAIETGEPIALSYGVDNTDRATGAMLGGEIARRYGMKGLAEDTINIAFTGTAGQSFGAFAVKGMTMTLVGEANDYVGKGLSGGRIIVRPPEASGIVPEQSIIVGNTVLYGAIAGECYFRGFAGERFAVRNSGALAVVEGTGDHGCEYMTGGVVVVIGRVGRNFAAGMSGGIAYVYDELGDFSKRCNLAMVELEPVISEDDLMEELHHHGGDLESKGRVDLSSDMTRHDEERLMQLLSHHARYTGSTKAQGILDNWEEERPKFIKVMPVEYRRALMEMDELRKGYASAAE